MRAVTAGNFAQPVSTLNDLTDVTKIEVANAADALVDLTDYAVSLEYDVTTDEKVDAATVVFRRLEGVNSLAPLMTASPPVNIGRRIVISTNPGAGFTEILRGRIKHVGWPDRFGDVTVQCLDQAGVAARAWIRTARQYGSTSGVSLETVMQAIVDDNLVNPFTLYFPVPTGAVVQHLAGDPPYGPTEQSVLDALRALAESIGWTIRWRHWGASASDWRWTVFGPSRTKTVADHTFGVSDYWDVTQIEQDEEDIRNMVEVAYVGPGETLASVTVQDAPSIAKYNGQEPLYMKIAEGSGSPVNNSTLATSLANAALSDQKEPDALMEITGRYFWPGEVSVDLYTFTANNKHFSTDQKLAAMAFRHRIAVGERPTTKIAVRGKPSGGVLMWQRRAKAVGVLASVPELRVSNFREVARTDTEVTYGWDVAGAIAEMWLYLSTPVQPVATDPWAALTGTTRTLADGTLLQHIRLTGATTNYVVPIPGPRFVTYGRLLPIGPSARLGTSWDFTVQGELVNYGMLGTAIVKLSPTDAEVQVTVEDPELFRQLYNGLSVTTFPVRFLYIEEVASFPAASDTFYDTPTDDDADALTPTFTAVLSIARDTVLNIVIQPQVLVCTKSINDPTRGAVTGTLLSLLLLPTVTVPHQ